MSKILELEKKLINSSSLVKMKEGDKPPKEYWVGWYRKDGEEEFKVAEE